MSEKSKPLDHTVLVKITDRGNSSVKERQQKAERIGKVLLVQVSEPMTHREQQNQEGSVTSTSLPANASTIVQIVITDPSLSKHPEERIIKQTFLENTVLETIKIGIAVPA